jgi:hypothetical protein
MTKGSKTNSVVSAEVGKDKPNPNAEKPGRAVHPVTGKVSKAVAKK